MSYKLLWEDRGVIKKFSGDLSSFDLTESAHEVNTDIRFDNLHWLIFDFLEVTSTSITYRAVEEVAVQQLGADLSNNRLKIAIVSNNPDLESKLSDYIDVTKTNHHCLRIHKIIDEAKNWIESWQEK